MNIYIYGSAAFNNEIHKILDHGNIRFKIEDGKITEIARLQDLKELIKEDPYQIFLIDENKIIENDFISKYLKFLIPKDGIQKSFLDQYGIGDISQRNYSDLLIYIEKRLETVMKKPKATEINSVEDIFDAFEYSEAEVNEKKGE
ncbi:MAG: hypothetical protein CSA86_01320 [Arcobacter sp.]|nr:MAG: hypothetical protein CSA86_01320 [Arcobacter sp.]